MGGEIEKGEGGKGGKGEGKGNNGENGEGGKGGKGKGKGKGKGSNENPELCCCEAGGEGPGGEGPGPVPEPRGFCIDEERVGAICIAGSNLEEKAKPAWEVCADQCMGYNKIVNQIQPFYGRSLAPLLEMRKGKGKGKGKGKPSKGGKGKGKGASNCPAVAVIIEEARQKYACDICYTTEMGWMDADMVADITRIERISYLSPMRSQMLLLAMIG